MPSTADQQQNADMARKTGELAASMYPREKWEPLEKGIYIAKSRMPRSAEQINILDKELRQARILVEQGSTVYLLPESEPSGAKRIKHPDAIVDGCIMEFKTVTGGLPKIVKRYKEAREKADHIFLKIDAPHTRHAVARHLSEYIVKKGYAGGLILVYFTESGQFCEWSEAELAQKKSGSCEPAATQGKPDKPECPR
jgi:hypothetical protein